MVGWLLSGAVFFVLVQIPGSHASAALNDSCNGVSCAPNYAFQGDETLYCWLTSGNIVTYCNGTAFVPLPSAPLPDAPCFGALTFTVGGTQYWYNTTTLYKMVGSTWTAQTNNTYAWFLSRLRPNEGVGWLYCSYNYYDEAVYPYYYDGNYYGISTGASGNVVTQSQAVSFYSLPRFDVVVGTEPGCQPVCCWYQDTYLKNGVAATSEFIYKQGAFYIWSTNQYVLYTGEFTNMTVECANYLTTASFTIQTTGKSYTLVNGSVYANSGGQPSGSPVAIDYVQYFNYDQLATGGYYHISTLTNLGMYRNETGDWGCNIVSGAIRCQKATPTCADRSLVNSAGQSGPPYPSCNTTIDTYRSYLYQICNPSATTNPCGTNYFCPAFPGAYLLPAQCTMSLCVPDYNHQLCAGATKPPTPAPATGSTDAGVTTATTDAPTTAGSTQSTTTSRIMSSLIKFGGSCTYGVECFTGICAGGRCVCSNCTKFLASVEYDMTFGLTTYAENCIPLSATVGSLGDPCDMWATIPTRYCPFGTTCIKCPETWSSSFSSATCVPIALTSHVACPSWMKCGYLANCTMIGGVVPSCVCPVGYNLEPNLMDCYGWKASESTDCSVTCGNGVMTSTMTCDKASGSKAICDGNSTVKVQPCTLNPCSINATMMPAAVSVSFASKVITVELFREMVKGALKAALVSVINAACVLDKDLYENQCCPGKAYYSGIAFDCINSQTGVYITNEYSDGANFGFYIFAMGDMDSSCCSHGTVREIARRKRSVVTGNFDQDALLPFVLSPPVMATMNSAIQSIDPSVVISSDSVSRFMTTTTTDDGHHSMTTSRTVELTGIGAMLPGVLGVISALIGLLVAGALIGGVFWFCCRRMKAEKAQLIKKPLTPPPKSQPPPEMTMAGNGQRRSGGHTVGGEHPPLATYHSLPPMGRSAAPVMMQHHQQQQQPQQPIGNANYPPYYAQYPLQPQNSTPMVNPKPAHEYY